MRRKIFLFMYPIQAYVEEEIKRRSCMMSSSQKESYIKKCSFINQIIDRRYRKRNFEIYFTLFSCDGNPSKVDYDIIAPLITIEKVDKIINVGISFKQHSLQEIYPDEEEILNKMGKIEILKIGGFHSADCIERIAKFAFNKGIDTKIIDDLTEDFFSLIKYNLVGIRPMIKEISEFISESRIAQEFRSKEQKQKPWLTQY